MLPCGARFCQLFEYNWRIEQTSQTNLTSKIACTIPNYSKRVCGLELSKAGVVEEIFTSRLLIAKIQPLKMKINWAGCEFQAGNESNELPDGVWGQGET